MTTHAPRTPKQEQEPATDEVVEVAPGVLRLQIPIEFTGLGHVNMYALIDDDGVAVVDPGLPGPDSWEWVVDRLGRAELTIDRVHTVIVTHSHPDHFGGAGRLAAEAGARLVAQSGFRVPWIAETWPDVVVLDEIGFPLGVPSDRHAHAGCHVHHLGDEMPVTWFGETKWDDDKSFMPPMAEIERIRSERAADPHAWLPPVPTVRLDDGDTLGLAGRPWRAIHTPGHTEDHLCLFDPDTGVLLTGDHVLPSITPHISGMGSTEVDDPLDAFVEALERVADMDVSTALPAHGHPFDDVAGRVDAIIEHHERRLERIVDIAESLGGIGTVEEFSQRLFAEHHWGLMAESEAFAHLEHLRHTGRAVVHRGGRAISYELTDSSIPRSDDRLEHRRRRAARHTGTDDQV